METSTKFPKHRNESDSRFPTYDTYSFNDLDDVQLAQNSFSFLDIQGKDSWNVFTPVFGSLTVVGATSYSGRYRIIGRMVQGQAQFSAATSIASVAGTDYMNLPIVAQGLAGMGSMGNNSTNVAVGLCHLNVAQSRLYLPSQVASGSVFTLKFQYES